jgi:NADPH-dependent 2,4-dienoyl-CoA reductase/sulfur reductase-like enzyme
MRIIIVGGVAAGAKAAAKARRVDPNHEIILYQNEAEVSYSACGMPYVISGVIDNRRKIVIRQPEDFVREGIEVLTRRLVTRIDKGKQQLTVTNLLDHSEEAVSYDRLILATGACPIVPKVEGIALDGVLTLRNFGDLVRFKSLLKSKHPKRAVIVGSGYIGLELAEAFQSLRIKTTLVEKAPRILPRFDVEMARYVSDHLLEKGVELLLGEGLARLYGENGRVNAVETESGTLLAADLVVIAMGVRPNVELAKTGGIALGQTGAIAVNSAMETRTPGIFAAGDCCETVNRITGKPVWMPLGDIANLQGRVAGENAAGGSAHFPGVFGTAIFKSFDLGVAMTGLSEQAALESGFDPVSVEMVGSDRARYYPGRRQFSFKLVADRRSGLVLGAQAVGSGTVDKMIDIVATALLGKLTCADLENADFAYSPPFSPVLSPVIVAAGALNKKLVS